MPNERRFAIKIVAIFNFRITDQIVKPILGKLDDPATAGDS